MGDISEIRGLVVVGSFLAILVTVLIAHIPSDFLVIQLGREITVPEFFEAEELVKYAVTWNASLDGKDKDPTEYATSWHIRTNVGGHEMKIIYAKPNQTFKDRGDIPEEDKDGVFLVQHVILWWIFVTDIHPMDILHQGYDQGKALSRTELDKAYEEGDLSFTFKCHFEINVLFAFNNSKYSKPSEAFDDKALKMVIGVEWDQVATATSGWDLVAMILFFQLPETHPIVKSIIAIPIWISIAYLSFILLLRAIGAIFGGGA